MDCYFENMTDSPSVRNDKLRLVVTTHPAFANPNGESLVYPAISAETAGAHARSLIRTFKSTFETGGVSNKKGDFNRVEHILHQIAKAEMEEEARRGDTKEKEKEDAAAAAAMEVRILSLAGAAGKKDAELFRGPPLYLSLSPCPHNFLTRSLPSPCCVFFYYQLAPKITRSGRRRPGGYLKPHPCPYRRLRTGARTATMTTRASASNASSPRRSKRRQRRPSELKRATLSRKQRQQRSPISRKAKPKPRSCWALFRPRSRPSSKAKPTLRSC